MLSKRITGFSGLALALIAGLTGCTTSSITNLTPLKQTRNESGLYPIEAAFDTRQKTVRWETIKPQVVVGYDFYPMRPTPLMSNRWETLIPIPPGTNVVYYKFKFDFDYDAFGPRRSDSALSREYRLEILDGK